MPSHPWVLGISIFVWLIDIMIKAVTDKVIEEAAAMLRAGGLVGMPTETVYGLAGNAFDERSVARIYEAKGRPAFNPLIVHYAVAPRVENEWYRVLAQAFWPGPLTMIVRRVAEFSDVSELATAGLDTVAVRVPAHPVARQLLRAVEFPLVAPSANKSGMLSPTTPSHVADGLGEAVDLILAAGGCAVGVESTVVDVSGEVPVILRPGAVTAADLSEVLGFEVRYGAADGEIKSPGQLLKHYAPETGVRLNAVDVAADEGLLGFGSLKFMGVKSGGFAKDLPKGQVFNLSEEGDLDEAAANLFRMLKDLDKGGFARIAVMAVPDVGLGVAINDRLKRASL